MTKKLEQLFDLPAVAENSAQQTILDHKDHIAQIDDAIDKIDAALPGVKDLDAADTEMDDLAALATDKFNDLMDLGMNVEPRYSGVIFQTAGTLLGHAITAKQAKMDKKLRMVELQLKKLRIDQISQKEGTNTPEPIDGQGMVLDRNTLLKEILGQNKKSDPAK
jgi:DNA-binding transcriptional regulator LsrR (DeoR family)